MTDRLRDDGGTREAPGDENRPRPGRGRRVGLGQCPHALHRVQEVVEPFGSHRARSPVAGQGDAHLEGLIGVRTVSPVERSAQVADLGIEALHPAR